MLHRAENVSISYKQNVIARNYVALMIGRKSYRITGISSSTYDNDRLQQRSQPVQIARVSQRTYWQFQDRFYWEDSGLTASKVYALLTAKEQRETARVERAQAVIAQRNLRPKQPRRREAIPDDVKQLVWLRDGGRCRGCGSGNELQFDHIIPIAMGGSSNAENLQILCGPCNRRKGAGLTLR